MRLLQDLNEVVKDKLLIVGVDSLAYNAKQPEDLKVLLLMVVRSLSLGDVVAGEILDDLPVHKIIDKEKVVPEQFLQEVQLAWLIVGDDIVEDELEPFGDMHLEELILAD